MKIILVLSVVLFQISASAASYICGGVSSTRNRKEVQLIIDQEKNSVMLNQLVVSGGMPPYPYVNVENWAITEDNSTGDSIFISGITIRPTTGTIGRIGIQGTRLNGPGRNIYNFEAKVKPASNRVIPVVIETIEGTCKVR